MALRSSAGGRLAMALGDRWKGEELNDVAAAVTYWTVLSLAPAALAVTAMLGWLELLVGKETADDVRERVVRFVEERMATSGGEVAKAIVDILSTPSGGVALVGFLIAVWSMSKGFAGLFRGLARAHGEAGTRSNLKGRALALGFGVATVVVIIVLLLSIVSGPLLGFERLLPNDGGILLAIWDWARWPVLAVAVVAWLGVLLSVGPGTGLRWRAALPGAILAAVAWVVITFGFQLYLRLSGGANPVFRSLGSIVVGLTWLYLLITALLVGGALNALLAEGATEAPAPAEVVTD